MCPSRVFFGFCLYKEWKRLSCLVRSRERERERAPDPRERTRLCRYPHSVGCALRVPRTLAALHRPRSVNRPKSSSGGVRACMRLIFAACGLTGRYWVSVDHTCCLWPCKTPETRIVHVYSLSALRLTASVPVDIRPSCLGIRPMPLLFWHYSDFIDDSRPCGTTLAILIVGEPQNHPIRLFLVPDRLLW